jgi:RNA polymerase sigma factor (sigma-70 family)
MGRSMQNLVDGEDAAGKALFQLLSGLQQGRFPDLTDRDGLWSVMWMIMERRLIDQQRKSVRRRRREVGASAIRAPNGSSGRSALGNPFDQFPVEEVTPEFLVILRQLMESLTQALRQVAELVLAGHTGREIARKLDCSEKTVQRRLKLIRHHWENEL